MVATRFAVAAHIMLLLAEGGLGGAGGADGLPATSSRLAAIVNTNPVVVRRITGQLARAGLVRVHRGPGGAELSRPPAQITLADIWSAVHPGPPRPLVPMHRLSLSAGQSERAAQAVLASSFADAESAFQTALAHTRLSALVPGPVHEPA